MAAGISGLLRGATKLLPPDIPLATVVSEVVSHATAAADQVLSQVQNAAAQVADLAAQVETDVLSPDGALLGAGSLLDNLETTIDSIVNGVVADVADVVPTQLLDEVKSLVTGGLNSILDATNGPIGVVASIIDINLCEAVKLVEGLLVTVTGVCGDMASVTSFSPTYSETASAAATGASLSFPTLTGVGLGSASAAQSATVPVPTNAVLPSLAWDRTQMVQELAYRLQQAIMEHLSLSQGQVLAQVEMASQLPMLQVVMVVPNLLLDLDLDLVQTLSEMGHKAPMAAMAFLRRQQVQTLDPQIHHQLLLGFPFLSRLKALGQMGLGQVAAICPRLLAYPMVLQDPFLQSLLVTEPADWE
ncbi:hypothetical protein LQW54_005919 [Pestalotiopsis sp. IQ-011]